jgi:hypothetical protein
MDNSIDERHIFHRLRVLNPYRDFFILIVFILTKIIGPMGASAVVPAEPATFWISADHFVKGEAIDLAREAPAVFHVGKID